MTAAAENSATVYVVDDVTTRPGAGEAFLEAYMSQYVPGAQARGLVLLHRLVSPPLWLGEQSNRLVFVWRAAGAAGVWAAKFTGRGDPELAAWWEREAAALVESRSRAVFADPAELVRLGDV